MWSSLGAKTCSSWAPFSQLRVILGQSLIGLEWRLFGRSGIVGLKIQNNVLIPIWDMQVGSRSLVTLRHSWIPIWEVHTWSRLEEKMCSSWGPFSQLRVILGPSLTNLELLQCCGILWLTPNEGDFWKDKFFISRYEIISGYPFDSCTYSPDCERRGSWDHFSQLRVILGQVSPAPNERYLEEVELWVLKYKIIFRYPFVRRKRVIERS